MQEGSLKLKIKVKRLPRRFSNSYEVDELWLTLANQFWHDNIGYLGLLAVLYLVLLLFILGI